MHVVFPHVCFCLCSFDAGFGHAAQCLADGQSSSKLTPLRTRTPSQDHHSRTWYHRGNGNKISTTGTPTQNSNQSLLRCSSFFNALLRSPLLSFTALCSPSLSFTPHLPSCALLCSPVLSLAPTAIPPELGQSQHGCSKGRASASRAVI